MNDFTTKQEYLDKVSQIDYHGKGTFTGKAIHYAATTGMSEAHGDRPDVPNFIVLLTDGRARDKSNEHTVKNTAPLLHQKGSIVCIGVGDKVRPNELQYIAGKNGQVFMVKDFRHLRSKQLRLTGQKLCPKRCLQPGDQDIYYTEGKYYDFGADTYQ